MSKEISNRELAERLFHKANGECKKCVCDGYCKNKTANCPETILHWLMGTPIIAGDVLHN